MGLIDVFFNLLLLVFFVRLCSKPDKEFYFNPFISGPAKFTDSVLSFLRSSLGVPDVVAAGMVFVFLFFLKTLFFQRSGGAVPLNIGEAFRFIPARPPGRETFFFILFSLLGTVLFFLRLWTVFLLVRFLQPRKDVSRVYESFRYFCRPFSFLPSAAGLFFLALLMFGVVFAITRLCAMAPPEQTAAGKLLAVPFASGPVVAQVLKIGWLAALSIADGLFFLNQAMFALVIGNLVFALVGWSLGVMICNEAVNMLMGRFCRASTYLTTFDLRTVVFFLLVNLAYGTVAGMLVQMIQSPMFIPGV